MQNHRMCFPCSVKFIYIGQGFHSSYCLSLPYFQNLLHWKKKDFLFNTVLLSLKTQRIFCCNHLLMNNITWHGLNIFKISSIWVKSFVYFYSTAPECVLDYFESGGHWKGGRTTKKILTSWFCSDVSILNIFDRCKLIVSQLKKWSKEETDETHAMYFLQCNYFY